MVERGPEEAGVAGSIPALTTAGREVLVPTQAHNLNLAGCNTGTCIHGM